MKSNHCLRSSSGQSSDQCSHNASECQTSVQHSFIETIMALQGDDLEARSISRLAMLYRTLFTCMSGPSGNFWCLCSRDMADAKANLVAPQSFGRECTEKHTKQWSR